MKRKKQAPKKKRSWFKTILVIMVIVALINAFKNKGEGFKFDLEV
ncbi:MAG: hypothetical protein ACP5F3_01900 [Candidatus Syntrophosphaera sp.]